MSLIELYAEKLYDEVKSKFKDNTLNIITIFDLLRLAMEIAESYKDLTGRQKKELVIRIMHEAIEDFVLDDMDNEALNIFVDKMVDVVIDNFVDINWGHLAINKKNKDKFKNCFPCCFKT